MIRPSLPDPSSHPRRQLGAAILSGFAVVLAGASFLMHAKAVEGAPVTPDLRRGSGWCLYSMTSGGVESMVLRNPPVTLRFGRRSFSGQAPNHFVGKLRMKQGWRISFALRGMTEMGSAPAVMKQESSFVELLDKISTYAFDGGDLVLSDGTTQNVLRFRAIRDASNPARSTSAFRECITLAVERCREGDLRCNIDLFCHA